MVTCLFCLFYNVEVNVDGGSMNVVWIPSMVKGITFFGETVRGITFINCYCHILEITFLVKN